MGRTTFLITVVGLCVFNCGTNYVKSETIPDAVEVSDLFSEGDSTGVSQPGDASSSTPPPKDLQCYYCSTVKENEHCYNISLLTTINSVVNDDASSNNASTEILPQTTCSDEAPYCQVRRVEYLITEDSPSDGYVRWSLERGCAATCNDFCVTMGTRTKVTYCTSCCTTPLCNTDNAATGPMKSMAALLTIAAVMAIT